MFEKSFQIILVYTEHKTVNLAVQISLIFNIRCDSFIVQIIRFARKYLFLELEVFVLGLTAGLII